MKKSLPALDLQDAAITGRARGALPSTWVRELGARCQLCDDREDESRPTISPSAARDRCGAAPTAGNGTVGGSRQAEVCGAELGPSRPRDRHSACSCGVVA